MPTIRGRLTVAYAVALGVTLVAFAFVIQVLQRDATFGEIERRVRAESDLVAGFLIEAHRARASILAPDAQTGRIVLAPDLWRVLESVAGYVAVLGPRQQIVFLSPDARALPVTGIARLVATAAVVSLAGPETMGKADLGPPAGRVRYFVRTVTEAGPEVSAVVSAVTTEAFAEVDSRIRAVADLAAAILTEAEQSRGSILLPDERGGRALTEPVARLLDPAPGIVLVVGPEDRTVVYRSPSARTVRTVVYRSPSARALPAGPVQMLIDRVRELADTAARYPQQAPWSFGFERFGSPLGRMRYFARPVRPEGDVSVEPWVIAGASAASGLLSPPRYVTAMLWTIPFAVAISLGIGYLLVGRTLKPVEQIVDEVEAISDGRSLHRRLGEPVGGEELSRLTRTLNAMLARLERSFGLLRRFTADASHELKTPLTVLRSGIERSITHPKVPDDVMEMLEETLLEVNRMADLVDSLLTLARADEGRAPLHLEEADLRDMLEEVRETASILGEQASIQVGVDIPSDPIVMRIDRSRVRQLLMNLLTNAIKYTPSGGTVQIACARSGSGIEVTVRDTGIGIAPGDLPHIFERFWRADPARSRTGSRPGAGLGLAISKWIAEAHGGGIEVQSRPGRGTTFTVTLPIDVRPEGGAAE